MSENVKKLVSFSNLEIKEFIEEYVKKVAEERDVSQSLVIEEYILAGIAKSFPERKSEVQEIYKKRYEKFIDKELLQSKD